MDLYSTLADDLETDCCFLDFLEIRESPRKTQKPVTNILVSGHEVQSASTKALICNFEVVEYKIPWPGVAFKYYITLFSVRRWGFLGWLRQELTQPMHHIGDT